MSLLSFIHRREIRVDQDLLLSADFYKLSELLPFLTFTDEELLVIKRTFTQEEAKWLLNYNGECKIITVEPDDYEDLKVLETLEKRLHVEKAESIGMNYIHGGETLLVFSDDVNSGKAMSVANMIKLHPVRKKDIEVTLQVLLKKVNLSCSEVQSGTGATNDDMATANEIDRQTKSDDIPKESRRKELIRNRLKQMFDDGYSVVNIRLDGSAVEQKTITLTEFYKRHNIAQGRLVGSWRVFERGQLDEIIDAGIAKRALDSVLKKYTINISNHGRVVRNDHRKQLFDAVKKIECPAAN